MPGLIQWILKLGYWHLFIQCPYSLLAVLEDHFIAPRSEFWV